MSARAEIAVVGGGAAGFAAALAFAARGRAVDLYTGTMPQAQGPLDPRVFELWPNAMRALAKILSREAIAELKWPTLERYDLRSRHGALLTSLPVGAISRRAGYDTYVATPSALHTALLGHVRASKRIDVRVATVKKMEGDSILGVTLSATRGKGGPYRLIVGADGRASTVRRLTESSNGPFPNRADAQLTRLAAICGYSDAGLAGDRDALGSGSAFASHGPDARIGVWSLPGDPTITPWIVFAPRKAIFDDVAHLPEGAELLRRTRAVVEPFCLAYRGLIESTRPDQVRCFPQWHLPVTLADWFMGSIALVGDAAHFVLPDLGQGCAMAFEDGEALARHFEGVDLKDRGQKRDALLLWRQERFERVLRVQRESLAAHHYSHIDLGMPQLRDRAIASIGGATLGEGIERMIRDDGTAATPC
ncbi:MAG TPA: hypothetical protein VG755_28055 [Nannocystaceae bacterium]|nr:hypothetical protein [Nannocystaceae bacterium]